MAARWRLDSPLTPGHYAAPPVQDIVETYLPHFEAAVRGGKLMGAMCSYNAETYGPVNNTPSCGERPNRNASLSLRPPSSASLPRPRANSAPGSPPQRTITCLRTSCEGSSTSADSLSATARPSRAS